MGRYLADTTSKSIPFAIRRGENHLLHCQQARTHRLRHAVSKNHLVYCHQALYAHVAIRRVEKSFGLLSPGSVRTRCDTPCRKIICFIVTRLCTHTLRYAVSKNHLVYCHQALYARVAIRRVEKSFGLLSPGSVRTRCDTPCRKIIWFIVTRLCTHALRYAVSKNHLVY